MRTNMIPTLQPRLVTGMLLGLAALSWGVRAAGAQNRPSLPDRWNLIVILTDDQGAWGVGAYGNDEIVTPAMDRLAREGALFTNAFAASGVCTPSRVAYLTGLYAIQAGMPDVPYLRNPD